MPCKLAELRKRVPMPIWQGDEQGGSYFPEAFILAGSVDRVRVDLTCMGGITGGRAIIDECLAAGVDFGPHMFPHTHSQVFSAWGFDDKPIEWGVPWTGVHPYDDALAQPEIMAGRTDEAAAAGAGLRQDDRQGVVPEPAAPGSRPHPRMTPGGAIDQGTAMTDEPTVPADYATTLFDLSGRVAVVTGAGSGLGAAISIGYAQLGVTVVVADVNAAGAEATARHHRRAGRQGDGRRSSTSPAGTSASRLPKR